MKEFDLELAKQGHPVVTRDGRSVRIICFNVKNKDYPIVALVTELNTNNENIETYTISGKYNISKEHSGEPSPLDLMMASKKHEGWINLYIGKDSYPLKPFPGCCIYNSKQDAKKASETTSSNIQHVATIKIEWED